MYLRIKELAEKKCVSLYTVSMETGIAQSILSRLKSDTTKNLSYKNIQTLANYFNVSVDWLRTGQGYMYDTARDHNINNGIVMGDNNKSNRLQYYRYKENDTNTDASKIEFLEAMLQEKERMIEEKDKIIAEKERMIQFLMREK